MQHWKRKKPTLFIQYLLSYLCITILSCAIIGLSLFSVFLHDLEQEEMRTNLHKLSLAVEDMENQLDILGEVSYKLASQVEYLPAYLEQNPYYEVELLKDFESYQNVSPLAKEYFLMYYHNRGHIYRSTGTTLTTELYFRRVLGIMDPSSLIDAMFHLNDFVFFTPEDTDNVLFAFPVRMAGNSSSTAALCFVVERSELLQRITDITGGFDGTISLFLEDRLLAASEDPADVQMRKIVSEKVPDYRFSITLELPKAMLQGHFSKFQGLGFLIIGAATIFLIGLAVWTAYRNFKPIRRIRAGLLAKGFQSDPARNELDEIEDAVFQTLERNTHANAQLTQQMEELRSQALRLLLSGDHSSDIVQRLQLLELPMEGNYYAVLFLIRTGSFEDEEQLPNWLSDLSDDRIRLYPVCDARKGDSLAVILALDNARDGQEALELTEALLESRGITADLGLGNAYDTLAQLPASYLEATEDCKQRTRKEQMDESDDLSYDNRYVLGMMRAIRSGSYEEAIQKLDLFIGELKHCAPSFLLQRYVFSDVMVALIGVGRELGHPVDKRQAGKLIAAQDLESFRESVLAILDWLCRIEVDDGSSADLSRQLLCYIDEHCLEYDLSLERLSREFGRSISVLSRLVKEAAGENYKDYVILLKIEHARKFLEAGFSVTDTCEKVGYSNLSHFIRTFKQLTGYTPSAYQKHGNLNGENLSK